jgi:hypothetical protein
MSSEEMSRKHALAKVVAEFDRLYPQGRYDSTVMRGEKGIPNFVTARSGHARQLTREARQALLALAYAWMKEVPRLAIRVAHAELISLIRQAVADLHAEGVLDDDDTANLKRLDEAVKETLENTRTDFTHSFPAWTLGMEFESPLIVGPISVMTRNQWLNAVDFSDYAKDNYLGGDPKNHEWKDTLGHALSEPTEVMQEGKAPLSALAALMYGPLRSAPSLVRLSLSGYEKSLSKKAARQVCKTALDGLSLMLGGEDLFHKQTLADDRMPPVDHHTLIESNGFLHLPGAGFNKRFDGIDVRVITDELRKDYMQPRLDALGHILHSLASPESHRHPQLAMRWAMALDWLAEGEREAGDAIGLAKIGTSLDVLTEGGKFGGILDMLSHLADWKEDDQFKIGPNSRTLRWLVKELYDNGRSRILHGNVFDRLNSFEDMRIVGAFLARVALIECALRLKHYTGEDSPKAFRTIPPVVDAADADAAMTSEA